MKSCLECIKCGHVVLPDEKAVTVYLFAQTAGMRPRLKSPAERIGFCPPCAASVAFGPPPDGALNIAAWRMIRNLVGADPAVTAIAWERLKLTLNAPAMLVSSDEPKPQLSAVS